MARAPLPIRNGLGPTRIRMPDDASASTVLDYLVGRFPQDADRLREKVAAREVVDAAGVPIGVDTPLVPRADIYLYRDEPDEPVVPFPIDILHRDENLVVVDKPHFLATTPRGAYVTRSALVVLRRQLDLPDLSPAHRLDRLTSGVLVSTARPEVRRAYQELFAHRAVEKEYHAVARFDPGLTFPRTVRSRMIKERGVLRAEEVPGEPNAETHADIVRHDGVHALYSLRPRTGRTHQLRLHMSSLGIPILGDNFYPEFYDVADDDYSAPLQLLARSIEFVDPFTRERRAFTSTRSLQLPTRA
ncbi:pseudouridine synthase [Rhodococcus sp. BP-252]|uniref:pseudouridine synthase n=1 Tax=unclassified Rhodococcus (in: high G+C Gram-positive bacteria) TaxID=192944 RepID=UPI001C9A4E00|nr:MULTISPECIES: pseudouridine synthase [unclassified Rhodococcus (in: high G+C Gram-positive bacteria)]MBY6412714.1 pseudouridine synthase [Rhodococcus sp. BP-320]MBY6417488.1 pseudouridine synthase [Rhodococcus sp. BP-321]MBY6421734.1 pseudouridine synthase [Rhodococcus sp. BP-324]MBY6427473.1 pseudouridine synthase [Rhodococcus sp. BP-323]MBY6432676.1 pseudouridine synthase [Rhodococcus sp. BP-322]